MAPKQRVGDGVQQDIGVAVALQVRSRAGCRRRPVAAVRREPVDGCRGRGQSGWYSSSHPFPYENLPPATAGRPAGLTARPVNLPLAARL